MPPKKKAREPKVFKDELRADEEKQSKKEETIAVVEAVLEAIITKPSAWDDPQLENIKSMICTIGRDRDRFPLPLGEDNTDNNESAVCALTAGVASLLYKREELNLTNTTLQITAASSEMKSSKLEGLLVAKQLEDIPHRIWKLNAIDADSNVITVRLDSTLNSEGKLLSPGAIINITSAFPVYMNYGDMYDMRCAIVLREFRIIGRRPVPGDLKVAPARLTVEASATHAQDAKVGDCCFHQPYKCSGELCSVHGIDFAVCLTKAVPIENVSLPKVARECVFVTKELKDMDNRNKRFLLYYYYATSVYQFHGRGNRIDLPECLVSTIRHKFPDPSK
ncbi:hypothetical protein ACHAWF_017086 [Thalassiosira exigua]